MSFEQKNLAPLFEMSREAVVGIADGTVLFANPAARRLLGCREGDSAESVFPKELLSDPAERFTAAVPLHGVPYEISVVRQGELTLFRVSGHETVKTFTASDRALAEFGSDLAAAQHALDRIHAGNDEPGGASASTLYRSFYRLRRLHRHLTLAECIANGSLPCRTQPTEMGSFCEKLCDSIGKTIQPLGYELRFEAPESACYAMADRDLIETLLLNLITNSLLHTEPGGSVVRVSLPASGDRCVIAVDDAGSGMDAEKLSGVLDGVSPMSFTDVKSGAGLGLYVCRGIAEAHGGMLILESREGKGTGVRVSLPKLPNNGIEYLSSGAQYRAAMENDPILIELSVFLDRSFYGKEILD